MGSIREVPQKNGGFSYHAEVRIKGSRPQRASFRTRTLAKKWVQDVESAIRDGRHFRTAEAKRHTVAELIDRFISEWLPKYEKYEAKQKRLLMWWRREIGHFLLADLLPAHVVAGRDKLLAGTTYRQTKRSGGTVNRYLAALSKVFTVAVKEWQWLEENSVSKVSKSSESKGRSRFLSKEEIGPLLESCKRSPSPYLYPIVKIALLSGMRFGEIANLQWADVDFELHQVILHETKNGDTRIVPMTNEMERAFRECQTYVSDRKGYVFPSQRRGANKPVAGVRYALLKATQEAGIEAFRFHDLRHTACSHMAMNGATQGELQEILGHRSSRMTARYRHYSKKHIANVMERTQANLLDEVNDEKSSEANKTR
jgi:integrase